MRKEESMIKIRKKKRNKMKKILYIIFFLTFLIDSVAYGESKLEKIKNKIKGAEDKVIGKVWGKCIAHSVPNIVNVLLNGSYHSEPLTSNVPALM